MLSMHIHKMSDNILMVPYICLNCCFEIKTCFLGNELTWKWKNDVSQSDYWDPISGVHVTQIKIDYEHSQKLRKFTGATYQNNPPT